MNNSSVRALVLVGCFVMLAAGAEVMTGRGPLYRYGGWKICAVVCLSSPPATMMLPSRRSSAGNFLTRCTAGCARVTLSRCSATTRASASNTAKPTANSFVRFMDAPR